MHAWQQMSAADLGRGIGTGEIDPVELAECFLDAIKAHPHGTRIYALSTNHRALAEAGASRDRARAGHRLSLLDGVPVSWKDLFDTAGIATEAGSKLLAGRVPQADAVVLQNATQMGLVCLGKTHMSELAFSGLGYNPSAGSPPCINDEEAVSGGSSSGAAASVAFGLAPVGIGSDTGGSVRVPSAWNDLVGLKTTIGRLSVSGSVPLCAAFDTVGPLCRTVEDASQLLALMEGTKAPDLGGATLQGTRFAILTTVAMEGLRDAPGAAFEGAVQKLRDAGAKIDTLAVPEMSEALAIGGPLYTAEAYATWGDSIEASPEKMYERVRERFRQGKDVLATDYINTWSRIREIRGAYLGATRSYDAVLIPTVPSLPPKMEKIAGDPDYFVSENLLALRNTRIGNLMGLCGLTLPTGTPSCGIQLMGAPMQEARILRLGVAAEAALA